ncbi:hypothetical protein TGPRC2_251885 [Toxoplasma gondii TgCatPRC2]|uniref:Uncharacterized protein n=4 Tax=Toxoplasma gondii TaxID=5811 RepID=A0A125YM72_TOXGV|nr:hypothetical protein TGME49_251885 [Toxoplasma gondii ME49]ESS34544.1 hypothetical protein TGVEG_251885 [Toxoplasma gondii VEG]KFH09166.1 hypothetical protein TGVAND_251885 [Toxoplasma gondii VAND]KYK62991.1 hypothetical protein TGPRC2_251885 [Toxoplasma gondii TgCatPRC2]EPT25255.1 hypothetical protein TGME49_251885 [Toxoplasma gondii ME49]CEL78705.1 TPA: hypothetical protein BN1205_000455 [Toxoplasma gondii VEG]|eukprot:XP_018635099.1 hypothetical protein TGME49_251885 [Toxoplasma gondii ME49]
MAQLLPAVRSHAFVVLSRPLSSHRRNFASAAISRNALERSAPPPPSSAVSAPSSSCTAAPSGERERESDACFAQKDGEKTLPCPSLRRPYRDFLRACAKTFGEDFEARFHVTRQMTQMLRGNPFRLPTDRLIRELKDASDFVRFHIVQAQLNPDTGAYRATPTDDHIRKGDVIELSGYDAERMQKLPWLSRKPGDSLPPEPTRETSPRQSTEAKF